MLDNDGNYFHIYSIIEVLFADSSLLSYNPLIKQTAVPLYDYALQYRSNVVENSIFHFQFNISIFPNPWNVC
jgi:hypothetical protein